MHHVHRYDIYETANAFDIVYTAEPSGREIRLNIPRQGMLEDSDRELNREQVELVAHRVGETLSHGLVSEIAYLDESQV